MARIDSSGIAATSLQEYVTLLGLRFRNALGDDLDLSPETPQGQIIGVLALTLAEFDEVAVAIANGLSLTHAQGTQLDALGSQLNIPRIQAVRSTVTATFTGMAGTVIPAGVRAAASDTAIFETTARATVGAQGTVDAPMRAVEYGPIAVAPGALNRLVAGRSGITAVTNAQAATVGRYRESDAVYRKRYRTVIARNAVRSKDAILSAVLNVADVEHAEVVENSTAAAVTRGGVSIAAHSIAVLVQGGTDAAIAAALAKAKPLGIGTVGTTSETVDGETIRFTRATDIPIAVGATISLRAGFNNISGLRQIRAALIEYVDRLAIGEGIASANDLFIPLYSVPGHIATNVTAARVTGATGITTANIGLGGTLSLADANITLTVSVS